MTTIEDNRALELEALLQTALEQFGGLPGGFVADEGDLVRVGSGYPFAGFNHVLRSRLDVASASHRIGTVLGAFRSAQVDFTWWVTPLTHPADLGRRLRAAGLREGEPEIGMILELGGGPDGRLPRAVATALDARQRPETTAGPILDEQSLVEWISVMSGSYAWSDHRKRDAVLALYAPMVGIDDDGPSNHFLVRVDGKPVACSTLFRVGEQAWVTNVGTVPTFRGRGFGTLATALSLDWAHRHGCHTASLAASSMGRAMYQRLGFRDICAFERYVSSDP